MQIINEGNWIERSQCYLCRAFDSLNKGEGYKKILSAVQIGILDYTLFPDSPEFYSTYRLMNVKSHKIYSDKLRLSVLDLKQIEKATEEDKAHLIDGWARLFKATTWKEMRELADRNPIFSEAVRTAVVLSNDEKIRLQCEAREDYYRRVGWKDEEIVNLTYEKQLQARKIEDQADEIGQQAKKIDQQANEIEHQAREIKQQNQEIIQLTSEKQQLASDNQQLTSKNQQLTSEIERLRQLLESASISDSAARKD